MKKIKQAKFMQHLLVAAAVILPGILYAQVCGHATEAELSALYVPSSPGQRPAPPIVPICVQSTPSILETAIFMAL